MKHRLLYSTTFFLFKLQPFFTLKARRTYVVVSKSQINVTPPPSLRPQSSSSSPGPMKGPTVAARLKHLQQGSLEKPRARKQKEEHPKAAGQQQVFHF
ncbi:hypothetical protein EYF80_065474 [Liparis tanakae]|uniref:Uncharacterized protein n=1 Tax=Liparis tanakae TaxID=230148 RepID=A0A4Z2E6M0_9TELE|nr:hypothetical protein EYF80_065474 [Liparis tanakae]